MALAGLPCSWTVALEFPSPSARLFLHHTCTAVHILAGPTSPVRFPSSSQAVSLVPFFCVFSWDRFLGELKSIVLSSKNVVVS